MPRPNCGLTSKNLFTKSRFKRELHALTSNADGFPPQAELLKIAAASFDSNKCEVILKHVFKKLQEEPAKFRKIEKALNLVAVLLDRGSKKVVFELKNKLFLVKNLAEFTFIQKKQNVGLKSELSSPGKGGRVGPGHRGGQPRRLRGRQEGR